MAASVSGSKPALCYVLNILSICYDYSQLRYKLIALWLVDVIQFETIVQ